jgi:hypothetical protein
MYMLILNFFLENTFYFYKMANKNLYFSHWLKNIKKFDFFTLNKLHVQWNFN